VAALALVFSGAAGYYFYSRPSPAPTTTVDVPPGTTIPPTVVAGGSVPGSLPATTPGSTPAAAVASPPPVEPATPAAAAPGFVAVTIDAHPWARVAITPVGSTPPTKVGTVVTPVSLDLAPGEYELTLENGGVTRTLSRKITVATGAPAAFRFPMPGFTPSAVVDQLMGSATR
jgi:hypothetical protein